MDARDAVEARLKLQGAMGKLSRMRPRDIDTPGTFNGYIDRAVKTLIALKLDLHEPEKSEPDPEKKKRQRKGNEPNREHQGGRDRSE